MDLYQKFLESSGVSTDTREIGSGMIYFALRGENFNGNAFAAEALSKGAILAVIDEEKYDKGEHYLLVDNVLETLQALANHHRREFIIPVLAITGSNGKTTTKELIAAVLSKKYKIISTRGNLNNHIGVPLTLLRLEKGVEIAVIEMGANHVGEIATLCEIAEPNHGIITNIGKAHLEGFGGYEGVLKAKSELYQYLREHKGNVFINSTDPVLKNMGKRFPAPYYFPQKDDFYHCQLKVISPHLKLSAESGEVIETQLPGEYNFYNIAAALCIGKYFEVPYDAANQAIREYAPRNNRSQIIKKGEITILLDAYNANPSSMEAAIENLKSMKASRKSVILGDMNELGEDSEAEHRKIGRILKDSGLDKVWLCGEQMRWAKQECPIAVYYEKKDDLEAHLKALSLPSATVLVKASRSLALETLMECF